MDRGNNQETRMATLVVHFCFMQFSDDEEMGWVKIHRKIMKSGVWGNPNYLMVWVWCLMRANVRDVVVPFNGVDIKLKRGEFITGRKKATQEMPISERNYRTALTYLENTQRVTIKTTNRFSVITVVKYGDYQDTSPKTTSKVTNKRPATDQQATTDKNYNNKKKNTASIEAEMQNSNATPIGELLAKHRPEFI